MNIATRTLVVAIVCLAAALPAAAQNPPERAARERARAQAERLREEQERRREQAADERRARIEAQRGPEYTEAFTRTLRIGSNGTFELANVAGDIVITGGGGDEVKIDAVKRVRQRSEQEARAQLQQLQIAVSTRSNQVEVRTEFPRRNNFRGSVDYTVALPDSTSVIVHTVAGDLRITNVRGELSADTVSGDVTASGIGRLRSLKTVSGDVQLTDAQVDDATIGSVSGDITARNVRGRSLDLGLVAGDIRFSDASFERVSLRTISGDVEYAGRLARNGRYQMQSQSGDIRLIPADDTGFDLDANSFNGGIRTDYSLRTTEVGGPGRRGRQSLRGTVGDATAVVTLRSFNGDISVLRR